MDIKITQTPRLEQKQILAPQQQQSLRLLQIPTLALMQTIQQEMQENPLLEAEDNELLLQENELLSPEQQSEEVSARDSDLDQYFLEINQDNFAPGQVPEQDDEQNLPLKSNVRDLSEHLLQQLVYFYDSESQEHAIGKFIIYNLNDDGLLDISPQDIAKQLKVAVSDVEKIRQEVMQFDPTGIGARNHQEMFIIQAKSAGIYDDIIKRLLSDLYEDFLRKHFQHICKKLNLEKKTLFHYLDIMRQHLDPRPTRQFETQETQYVIPELKVEKNNRGEWEIQLLNDRIPHLKVNPFYVNIIQSGKYSSQEEKEYLSRYFQRAKWFIGNIFRRQITLLNVAQAIFKRQKSFLEHGPSHFKPLVLRDIAKELDFHETTISRAVNNKYIQTPHGVYCLRDFFSTAIHMENGEDSSANAVKVQIAEIIKNEDPERPLSDQKITGILQKKGTSIARRTVAKYREQLGILPTHLRKKARVN